MKIGDLLEKKQADQKAVKIKQGIEQADQKNSIFKNIINSNSAFCGLIVGTNSTGKTTYIEQFIKNNNENNKQFIFISPYIEQKKAITENNILFINPNDFFNFENFENFNKSFIIFDDCRAYISVNVEEKNTKKLNNFLIQRRYMQVEMYFIFHSFAQIPTFLYDYFTNATIKKTTDNLVKLKSRLNKYKLISDTQNIVNKSNNNYYYKEINLK